MANFSFLADKTEYRSFSKDCIDAEESFQNSFDSCVGLVRKALEAAIKWVYSKDKNFTRTDKKLNLFEMISNPTFEQAVGKNLADKLHYCRKLGNDAMHPEYSEKKNFSAEEAIQCLKNLFDFVQWIDGHYGKNFQLRTFDAGEIPVKDPTWKKVLKGVGMVGAGALGTVALFVAWALSDDRERR